MSASANREPTTRIEREARAALKETGWTGPVSNGYGANSLLVIRRGILRLLLIWNRDGTTAGVHVSIHTPDDPQVYHLLGSKALHDQPTKAAWVEAIDAAVTEAEAKLTKLLKAFPRAVERGEGP